MISLREWQLTPKNFKNLIVQASSLDGLDRFQPFPIGMQYSYCYNFRKGDCMIILQIIITVILVLALAITTAVLILLAVGFYDKH